ncbi:MAG: DUF5320 domain-containing protein [Nitrospiraceae bacterium]|jgi:hypothetical protein|nr:DUF5320 domain-containing protein [Nitrospiraceae bacterium]
MPGFNQTGPQGFGPGTGRGLGPCGAGMRRQGFSGRGMGRRFLGARFQPGLRATDPSDERAWLTEEATALERALTDVRKRLDALTKNE